MAGKPVATVGSNHVCPMCSGTVPHVGGPVTLGETNILINNKPVATQGSMCTCAGPPDTIIQGNPSVLFNGKPVACLGDMTAHGGSIVVGEVNVTIGASSNSNSNSQPKEKIPFPKINAINRIQASVVGQNESIKQAEKNQEEAKKHGYLINADFSL